MTRTITVTTPSGSYQAVIGRGLLAGLGGRLREVSQPRSVLLIHDAALPRPLVEGVRQSLVDAGVTTSTVGMPATERDKSMGAAERLLEAAATARLERADAIVAMGGGVVGDVGGFVASTYRRGIDLIHCPTTLLSMVDASIGGKTAVNLVLGQRLLKNMVGTFHQPRLVLVDTDTLRTLPARHLRAGLGECVKHAMLAGDVVTPDFPGATPETDLLLCERLAAQFGGRDSHAGPGATAHSPPHPGPDPGPGPDLSIELIARHIAIKAAVVALDERERGGLGAPAIDAFPAREALNLGHTFGHALEALPNVSPDGDPAHAPLHHGEAVALGLIAAAATAEELRQAPPGTTDRIRATLARIGLPTRVRDLPSDATLIAAMMDDKKVLGGRLRLVLPSGALGRVRVREDPARAAVAAGLGAIRA